jgi:type II secretory pathway pseudopilin PulG
VESLVAIAILLTVISGVMLLVNQSIQTGQNVSNRLTASYLASDAIEYIRYDRDSTWLSGGTDEFQDWVDTIPSSCRYNSSACRVDTRPGEELIDECSGGCQPLDYNESSYSYGYDSGANWEQSRFTREVNFVELNDLDPDNYYEEIVVQVTVSWPSSLGGSGELVLTDTLSSWGD